MPDPGSFTHLLDALAHRYRIGRELGAGGMATVYLAEDLKHHRKVAVKVLKPEVALVLGPERFLAEIEITAQLNHPHILPLLDSGEAGGFVFYAMPFAEGESLRERLNREKQLPLEDALQIAREVADALDYAHLHQVIHRDIKPENILLEGRHAVVADFGIARAVNLAGGERLTATGVAVGTAAYMSPEQASGSRDLDGRSDLYALACVLYEMLAGQPPFPGPTVETILRQHLTTEPVSITALRPTVPGWVAASLSRALAKSPADRFTRVSQFAEALARPTSTAGGTPGPRVTGPARRGRTLGLIALALAAVLGGWWGATRLFGPPRVPSLVVLPLQNLSNDLEKDYLVEGIHDALIGELGQIAGLRVISRTTAMSFKGSAKTVPEIARELNVDAVVEGTVFPAGDSIRLQVQLIGARPERHLWARAYERDLRGALTLGDLARTIAEQIQVTLTPQEVAHLAAGRPADPDAQDRYLRGLQLLYSRDPKGILGSIEEFKRAIVIDPGYASAYAALAWAYDVALTYWLAPGDSAYTWAGLALALADRAIELDPRNARAYLARSGAGLWAGAPANRVEPDLLQTIQLKPSFVEAHSNYATYLAAQGRVREAYDAVERAIELDPLAVGPRTVQVNTARMADDWERVLATAHQFRTLYPGFQLAWAFEGMALVVLGRPAECLALERLPTGMEAICLHAVGRATEAEAKIGLVAEGWTRGELTSPPYYLVWYYASAGQLDEAISWVERAFERAPAGYGGPGLPTGEVRPVVDLQGGRFRATVERLRRRAWERVLAESRTVAVR